MFCPCERRREGWMCVPFGQTMGLCLVDGIVMSLCAWLAGARDGMHTTTVEKVRRGTEASAASTAAPRGSFSPESGSSSTAAVSPTHLSPTGLFCRGRANRHSACSGPDGGTGVVWADFLSVQYALDVRDEMSRAWQQHGDRVLGCTLYLHVSD